MNTYDFIRDILKIENGQVIQATAKVAEIRHVKKGERLIWQGEIPKHIMILMSEGIIRGAWTDSEGADITDCFVIRPGSSVMPGNRPMEPAPVTMESLTDTDIFCIPVEDAAELLKNYPEVVHLMLQLIAEACDTHWILKMNNYRYSAMERYQWFQENYPGVIDQVNNQHVASFLNMTSVTLSRLRRQLMANTDRKK